MNEDFLEQTQSFRQAIAAENLIFKEYLHKSISRIQKDVDKITKFIYKFMQNEIDFLQNSLPENFQIVICPAAYFSGDDVGPRYAANLSICYYLLIIENSENYLNCVESSFKDSKLDLTFKSISDKIVELQNHGITLKTSIEEEDSSDRLKAIQRILIK